MHDALLLMKLFTNAGYFKANLPSPFKVILVGFKVKGLLANFFLSFLIYYSYTPAELLKTLLLYCV